jgi:organic hydroperoxide reductase OsmC/OhrA
VLPVSVTLLPAAGLLENPSRHAAAAIRLGERSQDSETNAWERSVKISAHVQNSRGRHQVTLITDGEVHSLAIPPKLTGFGSSVNGGELLFLAVATCYCNDIYREADKRGIEIVAVDVGVEGDFGAAGEPAQRVTYRAKVRAKASEADIRALMKYTDAVAEIQNTLRGGTPVGLRQVEVETA